MQDHLQHSRSSVRGSTLETMVEKLGQRSELSAGDRAAILALPYQVRMVEPRHFVVRDGQLATHSCLLLSGVAVRSKVVATGHRQILAIHIRGDMVDLQNSLLTVADHSVEMLTAGKVAMIPREEIVRISFARPRVGEAMWLDTLVDASISREWLANLGRRDARTRIAHLFCEFGLRLEVAGLGQQTGYELPITQEQLADATGLTSVHVNRTIKSLEREGLIERVHPRSIHIGDWRRLAHVGDFDSNYLHLHSHEFGLGSGEPTGRFQRPI